MLDEAPVRFGDLDNDTDSDTGWMTDVKGKGKSRAKSPRNGSEASPRGKDHLGELPKQKGVGRKAKATGELHVPPCERCRKAGEACQKEVKRGPCVRCKQKKVGCSVNPNPSGRKILKPRGGGKRPDTDSEYEPTSPKPKAKPKAKQGRSKTALEIIDGFSKLEKETRGRIDSPAEIPVDVDDLMEAIEHE
jgi:hypothetical protein